MTIDPVRWIALLLVAALCTATGWQIRDWKAGSDEAARLERKAESETLARELIAGVAKRTLTAIDGIKVVNTTIYQKTRHEITRDPVYVDCRIPADGMQLINAARSGIDRPVPATPVP
ncbi:MAG: hypothetical protein K2Y25_09255 [Pseudomonadaceae bacterium]|nr:hypothetical protein [Pseudomonadaceae bacterium]